MNITIRQAILKDLPEIQKLFVDAISSSCKSDYNAEQIQAWTLSIENKERWKNKLASQYFLIAEIKSKIVGFGSLESGNYLGSAEKLKE
jgi:putative acetyltransferase